MKEKEQLLLDGGVTKQDTDSFAYGVLADLGFDDWGVDWSRSSPGLCIFDMKKILLPIKYLATQPLWFSFEYVLHEIAHINTYTGRGGGHTPKFFSEYARLVDMYLGVVDKRGVQIV